MILNPQHDALSLLCFYMLDAYREDRAAYSVDFSGHSSITLECPPDCTPLLLFPIGITDIMNSTTGQRLRVLVVGFLHPSMPRPCPQDISRCGRVDAVALLREEFPREYAELKPSLRHGSHSTLELLRPSGGRSSTLFMSSGYNTFYAQIA